MSDLEFNKIFAAILVAGLVAKLSGFAAEQMFTTGHGHGDGHEKGYLVEVTGQEPGQDSAPEKPQKAEPISDLLASADVEHGKQLSRACQACHTFEKGGANKIGPNLYGVVGRDIASHEGFAYSGAMEDMDGVWTYEKLNQLIWNPKTFVSGTKMNYIGMKKPQDRADMIAWLRSLSDDPEPLPSNSDADLNE